MAVDAQPAAAGWLVRNYGPRCTLVCAASLLQSLGAQSADLLPILEHGTGFRETYGPPIVAYLGGHSALDRSIERAARAGGIRVRSRTRFLVRFADIARCLDAQGGVILNCFRAPSGQRSHSVLAIGHQQRPRRILTLDPNDATQHWLTWLRPATGLVCTATFVARR
ncbi:MAG: hypothetical protein JOZ39_10520 [Chloroflexi bacterium]|nr:hypothetical protein [Chloroflexota bacterium]